jgi:PelA/Pel-15E family pectate lyase
MIYNCSFSQHLSSMRQKILSSLLLLSLPAIASAATPSKDEIKAAIKKASAFFHEQVAYEGGYLWYYSGDLKLGEAEGLPDKGVVWVQPPGTPAIGETFLEAWQATGDARLLEYADTTAKAIVRGQLHSGGWDHSIDLREDKRAPHGYRDLEKKKKPESRTSLDDDITTSALRFLMRYDAATKYQHAEIKEAVMHGLQAIRAAQYPNGGWYQWWLTFPKPASDAEYPVKTASYPESSPPTWDNKWTGRYYLNDNVAVNAMDTLALASRVYDDPQWLEVAKKAGDFLLLAQMPDPQPAWAQQYDPEMHPVWDRKFEPPAISSRESERVLLGLIRLYHATGDAKYLQPHDKAIAYLKTCLLPEGLMPRYRELKTNRPLYFKREGKIYTLVYDDSDLPKHYGFKVPSILGYVSEELKQARSARDESRLMREPDLEAPPSAEKIIVSLDSRGAWIEKGGLDFHEIEPPSGIISCATFVRNMKVLCEAVGN